MADTLTASNALSYIRDVVDETDSANSYWSDASIIRFMNRTLENVSSTEPVRLVTWTITGDGSTLLFTPPEPVLFSEVFLDNQIPVPKISYRESLQARRVTLLAGSIYADYGFAQVGNDIRVVPALASGETRTFHYRSLVGNVLETAYSTGTVSVTNDSATITGSGTTWTGGNANANDSITINSVYYKIKSVDSATQITLTENYRGSTASGVSYEVGDDTGLGPIWNEALTLGVLYQMYRKDKSQDWRAYRTDYRQEKTRVSGIWERMYRPDSYLARRA